MAVIFGTKNFSRFQNFLVGGDGASIKVGCIADTGDTQNPVFLMNSYGYFGNRTFQLRLHQSPAGTGKSAGVSNEGPGKPNVHALTAIPFSSATWRASRSSSRSYAWLISGNRSPNASRLVPVKDLRLVHTHQVDVIGIISDDHFSGGNPGELRLRHW